MKSRSYYSQPVSFNRIAFATAGLIVALAGIPSRAFAGDAPAWMHALVSAPVPTHDDKTDAVLLYSEQIVNVQSQDKVRTVVREAYKILRPEGRGYGFVVVPFNSHVKISNLHGWCIPAQGRTTRSRTRTV